MDAEEIEHDVTLWMIDDVPARMVYAGRRWRVTDTPTRLRESVWAADRPNGRGLYGWRFQASDEAGDSYVFDIFRGEHDWHVHHRYS